MWNLTVMKQHEDIHCIPSRLHQGYRDATEAANRKSNIRKWSKYSFGIKWFMYALHYFNQYYWHGDFSSDVSHHDSKSCRVESPSAVPVREHHDFFSWMS